MNFGILPLTFVNPADYDNAEPQDELRIADVRTRLSESPTLVVENKAKGSKFEVRHDLTPRQVEIILAGGMLNFTKKSAKG